MKQIIDFISTSVKIFPKLPVSLESRLKINQSLNNKTMKKHVLKNNLKQVN